MTPDDEPPEPASPAPALRPEADAPTEPIVDPHNPHDGLFRRIFADPDHAGSHLASASGLLRQGSMSKSTSSPRAGRPPRWIATSAI